MTHAEVRKALSTWPDAWRERWGRKSVELAEAGVAWPDHETAAFIEVSEAKAKGGDAGPATTITPPARKVIIPKQRGFF